MINGAACVSYSLSRFAITALWLRDARGHNFQSKKKRAYSHSQSDFQKHSNLKKHSSIFNIILR